MVSTEDIHVGDRVRIRERADMLEKYGGDVDGSIRTPGWIWVSGMDKYCGKEATVRCISEDVRDNGFGESAEIWFEGDVCGNVHYTVAMVELVDTTTPLYEITDEEFFKILEGE